MLFRRKPKTAPVEHTPIKKLPKGHSTTVLLPQGSRCPTRINDRLGAALLATGAKYAVALDNGLLPFAQQPGKGQRLPGGATYWSVDKALRVRKPTYPRLSTHEGRAAVAHNPEGSGVVVADDVFVWTPNPGPAPSEWLAYVQDYLDLDFEPEGLPVIFSAIDIGPWGGVMVLARLVEEICALGINAQLMHSVHHRHSIKMPFSPRRIASNQWKTSLPENAVVLATNWWSASFLPEKREGLISASYLQDCESRFVNKDGKSNLTEPVCDRYLARKHKIANSPWVVDAVREDHGVEDMPWIPIGLDLDKFYPEPKGQGPIRILAMHRPVTPRRGHKRLKRLYEDLRHAYGTKVQLEVFGETKPACGAEDVHHGWLSEDEVAEVTRGADIFIEPSDFQGWGLPGHQALACGCALVSTACGGPEAYLTHEENGLMVPHDDLFDAVCRVIDDKELRTRLQEAGPASVVHTAWPEVAKQWKAYLETLVEQYGLALE